MNTKQYIEESMDRIRVAVKHSKVESRMIIARYTAAIAVNFTDWMGKTYPWVKHEFAQYVLKDNLRCEAAEDHVGMLYRFAHLSGALPHYEDYQRTHVQVTQIRRMLADVRTAGLCGVALCAALESTSAIFIPDLERRAVECGCTDLTYTKKHGEADAKHSEAFLKAVELESEMGYPDFGYTTTMVVDLAGALIERIYE